MWDNIQHPSVYCSKFVHFFCGFRDFLSPFCPSWRHTCLHQGQHSRKEQIIFHLRKFLIQSSFLSALRGSSSPMKTPPYFEKSRQPHLFLFSCSTPEPGRGIKPCGKRLGLMRDTAEKQMMFNCSAPENFFARQSVSIFFFRKNPADDGRRDYGHAFISTLQFKQGGIPEQLLLFSGEHNFFILLRNGLAVFPLS